jgi:hypothetical protein
MPVLASNSRAAAGYPCWLQHFIIVNNTAVVVKRMMPCMFMVCKAHEYVQLPVNTWLVQYATACMLPVLVH